MKCRFTRGQKGFTVVELLVATAVFSVVLIVFMTAFLRISQLFYKGVNMAKTQEAARNTVQDISDDLQFSKDSPTQGYNFFCIGIHRYTFYPGVQVGSSGTNGYEGILKDSVGSGCPNPSTGTYPINLSKTEQLLDPGMAVNKLDLSNCNNSHCTISLHIVFYGADRTVLVPNYQDANAQCSGSNTSSQYCSTADYKSTVLQNF